MERLDKELQQRVWQRVQSREKTDLPLLEQENLRPLLLALQENGAAYQNLSRQLPGKEGEKARKLWQESQRCLACLKGICRIRGESVKLPQLPVQKEQVQRSLMKCYHRERNLWSEWEHRSGDGEYGPVYAQLARQARDRCASVMEILGNLEK